MEAAVRKLAVRLPEVTEQVDGFGHTSFRVSDKPFVIMGEGGADGPALSFKVLKTTQEILLAQEHFYKTPYIGHHGWVSIRAKNIADYDMLADYLLEGYLCAAPSAWSSRCRRTRRHSRAGLWVLFAGKGRLPLMSPAIIHK